MLPQSLAALYAFLGLVAPGLVYTWLRERDLPLPGESAFREISRIAIASLVFSWLSVMMLALASRVGAGDLLVDLSDWVAQGTGYLEDHLWLAAWSATVEVALACGLAWLATHILKRADAGRVLQSAPVVYRTPMYDALQGRMGRSEVPWVVVYMNDGTRIWGKVFRYTIEQVAADEQQLAISGPGLAVQGPTGARQEQGYWEIIIVKASDIHMIKVATTK